MKQLLLQKRLNKKPTVTEPPENLPKRKGAESLCLAIGKSEAVFVMKKICLILALVITFSVCVKAACEHIKSESGENPEAINSEVLNASLNSKSKGNSEYVPSNSEIKNGNEYIPLKSKINNIFCFSGKRAIANLENGEIHKLDLKSGKISKDFIKGTRVIKKLNNAIAVQKEKEILIYDTDLKLVNSVKYPFSIYEDEVSFSVSLDGKSFVYCINEGNSRNVYLCPIDLSSKKLLYSFSNDNSVGTVKWFDDIIAVEGEKVLFVGLYISEAMPNGDTVLNSCCGILDNGTITSQKGLNENLFYSIQNCLVVADNSPLVFGDTDGVVEYWDVVSKEMKSFKFPADNESRCAFVSPDLNYIVSQEASKDGQSVTVTLYRISDKAQLFQKTYSSPGTLGLDFCPKEAIAVFVNGKDFDVVKLT